MTLSNFWNGFWVLAGIVFFGWIAWQIFLSMIGAVFYVWDRHRSRRQNDKEYEAYRKKERQIKREFMESPELLRGHDYVAAIWFDYIRNRDADPELLAQVVAAATAVERQWHRHYDGRPIREGWMTTENFEEYFRFIDSYGLWPQRSRAIFQREMHRHDVLRRARERLAVQSDWIVDQVYQQLATNVASLSGPKKSRYAAPASGGRRRASRDPGRTGARSATGNL